MITIYENEHPKLNHVEMVCDKPLADKLNKYDVTKLLNRHSTNLFIGKQGSGKTSLFCSFLTSPDVLKKVFHTIIVFQPKRSRESMKNDIFEPLEKKGQVFEELTYEDLEHSLGVFEAEDSKYNNCIIFDDMTAYLKDTNLFKLFKKMIANQRHYRLSIYILVQTWKSVPKDLRKLLHNLFVFRVSKQELEDIFKETVEGKEKYVKELADIVYTEPYKYLVINTNSQRMFSGFDEIIIEDSDEI